MGKLPELFFLRAVMKSRTLNLEAGEWGIVLFLVYRRFTAGYSVKLQYEGTYL
jgi:hypothetical protein